MKLSTVLYVATGILFAASTVFCIAAIWTSGHTSHNLLLTGGALSAAACLAVVVAGFVAIGEYYR